MAAANTMELRALADAEFSADLAPVAVKLVAGKPKTGRPVRHAIAARCEADWARYQSDIMGKRLPGSTLRIGVAIMAACNGPSRGGCLAELGAKLVEALGAVGVHVASEHLSGAASPAESRVWLEPLLLRKAFPGVPRLEPHTFRCEMRWAGDAAEQQVAPRASEGASSETGRNQCSRYPSGVSDQDELRLQVEVLRQTLSGLELTVDRALDELCAGLQNPCTEVRARCERIVQTLDQCGLRFHQVKKSWRLPRAGILLIERPHALVGQFPSLAFFEPHRFRRLAIVDRPARAGGEVLQGLLF